MRLLSLAILLSLLVDARASTIWGSSARRNLTELNQLFAGSTEPDIDRLSPKGLTGLHYACMQGDSDIVQLLLKHKADPNFKSTTSQSTPLLLAVSRAHPSLVPLLLAAGADPNAANKVGATPLLKAVEHKLEEAVHALIGAKANVQHATTEGETALHLASEIGSAKIAALLIDNGAVVDALTTKISVLAGYGGGDRGLTTPLHEAAAEGQLEVVQLLLARGADPNLTDAEAENALTKAVKSGSAATVTLLGERATVQEEQIQEMWHPAVQHGRLPQLKAILALDGLSRCSWAKDNRTALHVAAKEGRKTTWALLLNDTIKQGCSLDVQDSQGRTALMLAAAEGHAVVVNKLLQAGADTSLKDHHEPTARSALYWGCMRGHSRVVKALYDQSSLSVQDQLQLMAVAVSQGHTTVVELFQEAGVLPVQIVDAHNMTVLEVAVQWNQVHVLSQLLDHTSGSAITKHHTDALHLAASLGTASIVNKLVVAGVDVNARDSTAWTPLMRAASRGTVKAAQSLVDLGAEINLTDENGSNASRIAHRHEQNSPELRKVLQPDGWTPSDEVEIPESDSTPMLQIAELHNTNFDQRVIEDSAGVWLVLFTMGSSGDSDSAELHKKFEQASAEAHGMAHFGIVDAAGLSNGPLRRRWEINHFPSILVFRPNQRGEKGTTEGPRLYDGVMTSEGIFDSIMELNYESQRAIRLQKTQEDQTVTVELTQPKKVSNQLYDVNQDDDVAGRVDDEL